MSEVLKIACRSATVELTLNRPQCRNALARDLVAALSAALRAAEQTLAFGLCNEVVPDDELLPRSRYYAELFASHPREALASTKRLFRELRGGMRGSFAE